MTDARAWVDVDLDAVRANYRTVRDRARPRVGVVPMVKANGYGLGAERIVRALDPLGPWGYGVAAAAEGAALRELGVERPIVVFSPLPPGDVALAAEAGLTATISDLGGLDRWLAAARSRRPLDYHVEIDTGMGRCGFDWRSVEVWGREIVARTSEAVRWTGVYTHFHSADEADATPSRAQWERFETALVQLPIGRESLLVHAANSAASLRWPEYGLDLVRPGIFLYGVQAADDPQAPLPQPVASVRARLVLVRDVPPGSTVGYGAEHVAQRDERWGTLDIGYGDGYPRAMGNRGHALVKGRRVPIVGRISMDLTVVDLTEVPDAQVGDVATLIGADGDAEIRVEEVAEHARTIGYEVLTGLGARLPRVEHGGG
ncbi:MAG: alanine racemase [Gemmatimonadota bacterium]